MIFLCKNQCIIVFLNSCSKVSNGEGIVKMFRLEAELQL